MLGQRGESVLLAGGSVFARQDVEGRKVCWQCKMHLCGKAFARQGWWQSESAFAWGKMNGVAEMLGQGKVYLRGRDVEAWRCWQGEVHSLGKDVGGGGFWSRRDVLLGAAQA
jgi:hypothetical protein